MIGMLTGNVIEIFNEIILIDVNGIGFEVTCSKSLIDSLKRGKSSTIITYTEVREDLIRLVGLANRLEREVFRLLITVKGVGVRIALDIVSQLTCNELLKYINSGDFNALSKIKGIGSKTAQRLVLELQDKVTELITDVDELEPIVKLGNNKNIWEDVAEALKSLGFSKDIANKAIENAMLQYKSDQLVNDNKVYDLGNLVRLTLKYV
jgi:holliday junction DNA helicase RuvA